jgi:hypothetical protein
MTTPPDAGESPGINAESRIPAKETAPESATKSNNQNYYDPRYLSTENAEFLEFDFVQPIDAARRRALTKCETVIAAWMSCGNFRGGYRWSADAKFTSRILREARQVIKEARLSLQSLPLFAWAEESEVAK